jgi:hypothetical protein
MDCINLIQDKMAFFKHSTEPSGFIGGGEFLDQQSGCYLLEAGFASRSVRYSVIRGFYFGDSLPRT